MGTIKLFDQAHRRFNPLTREWVLVSPHRTERPWQGREEKPLEIPCVSYDPDCYLCPGNARAGGARNPVYTSTFAFDNDFPALVPAPSEAGGGSAEDLFVAQPESGTCRVLCFSPRHDLTLALMSPAEIR